MQKNQIKHQNIELKNHCSDFEPIRKYLKKIKAKKLPTVQQKDYYFNLPKSQLPAKLKSRFFKKTKTSHQLIYYKRTRFKDQINSQLLINPSSKQSTFKILQKALGIKAVVEKSREQWQKQNIVFNLDTVKQVGQIFEIEVEVKDLKKDKLKFQKHQKNLLPLLGKKAQPNLDLVLESKNT